MVLIDHGINGDNFTVVANKHWKIINPFSVALNRYYKGEALVDRVEQMSLFHKGAGNFRQYHFYEALLSNTLLKRLVVSPANLLPALITEVEAIILKWGLDTFVHPTNDKYSFRAEVLNVFKYENWRTNGKGAELYSLLEYEVCPYCNLAPVYKDPKRNFLVLEYDHYYDKASYPYLSLSFSNLIPVCDTCNAPYKGTKPFSLATHLHPYVDDFNTNAVFTSNYVPGAANYTVHINATNLPNPRTVQFYDDLGLPERYDRLNVKKHAKRLFDLGRRYPLIRKRALAVFLRKTILQVEEKICEDNDICFTPSNILYDQFGKLKRDLSKQYKIITTIQ